jgi:hypothetical protein
MEPASAAARSERISACLTSQPEPRKTRHVTHQIRRNDRIQRLWVKHHPARHGVDEHLIALYVREVFRDFRCNFVPHDHSVALCVALCNDCNLFPRPALSCFKGKAYKTFYTMAGEDGNLSGSLPLLASMRPASLSRIFTFRVLSDNHPV